ncbi:MFS transporter [Micromonospora sp. NPDC050686]|uniref:MFS transporter n=1 Tax=Micromonospora sp. NPDC050686 TaxID=3154631 RepID=UPI0033C3E66D
MNVPRRALGVIATMNAAQLPVAMRQLLVVLLGHHNTGSFAAAGLASAACGLGLALSAPVSGRLLGRFGDPPVLRAFGAAHLCALLGLAVTTDARVFVALAAVAGLATPPVVSSGRALLPALVGPAALSRAYAVNAVGQELLYVGGPLVVTLSLAVTGPSGALLAFAGVGTAALVANTVLIPRRARLAAHRRTPLPASGRVAVRTLTSVHFAYMTCMGAMWVLLPAFAAAAGRANQAGLLVAVWSAGSLAGGLLLAAAGRGRRLSRAYLVLIGALAATATGLLLPHTVVQMAVAVALFGLPLAPWLAVSDELIARVAPHPHTAEAYGWLLTAGQLGVATGATTSGLVNDHFGTRTALLVVPLSLAAATGVALLRRRTLAVGAEPTDGPGRAAATAPAPAGSGRASPG